ncbi:venom metalloproteinase antarease-like TtrivMP_A [Ixodes scapularis]|uniref:venom metalloproteinase antarease-like TtrivMP_A n=1 Tax=Ixodes scapularis TaxID=6945 RepID=UPI001A9F63B9|nr:venom metalloproteinase antarease-like TtrivMP_A [Ixodes scapularis]
MSEDAGFVVALMLGAVLAAAGLPSENIVYPRIIESRDLNGERTLYIRPGLVLSLEKSRVFSDNFVFSEDDGVNRHEILMNGKDLEKNFYRDRNHSSVVFVDEEKGAVEVRGILNNRFSIEPIASGRRSEDDLVAHTLSPLDDIDNQLEDNSVLDQSLCPAQDAGLSTIEVSERKLEDLPEEFLVEVRIFADPSFGPKKTVDDFIKYFGILMSQVNQMYKQLTKPKVQFIVLSITKLTNYTFTSMGRDPERDRWLIDACGTVETFYEYANATLTEDTQDAIIYVSSLHIEGNNMGGCSKYCHVCKKNPITAQTMNMGRPGAKQPKIIARELGHLLGMTHEGYCPWYSTPGKETLRCKGKDHGYVLGRGKPPNYFSYCLQDQAKGCLMTKTKRCFDQTGGQKIF